MCSGPGHTVIESVALEQGGCGGEVLVARVRVKAGVGRRCSRCQRRCPGYDTSASPRRWRGLDLGSTQGFLQATTSRVSCPAHGVVVAAVPWAWPGSRFTTAFEDTARFPGAGSVPATMCRTHWSTSRCHPTLVVITRDRTRRAITDYELPGPITSNRGSGCDVVSPRPVTFCDRVEWRRAGAGGTSVGAACPC